MDGEEESVQPFFHDVWILGTLHWRESCAAWRSSSIQRDANGGGWERAMSDDVKLAKGMQCSVVQWCRDGPGLWTLKLLCS